MRIAICFSAQTRTALYAADYIKTFIGPLWNQCDFFCHTWLKDTDKLFDHGMHVLENKITIEQSTIDKLQDIYQFKKFKIENYEDLVLIEPRHPPLFYSWIESLKQKQEYEQEHNFKYDVVVKIRLDNIYRDSLTLSSLLEKFEPNSLAANNVMDNGSVDDFIFISDTQVADKMIDWYDPWLNKSKVFFAQLEMPDYLKEQGIKLINLGYDTGQPIGVGSDICILRLICLDFIGNYGKCVECDKILYWDGPKTVDEINYLTYDELLDLARRVKAKYNKLPNVLAHFEDKI